MSTPSPSERRVEELSAELHTIYQREARRQAGTGEDSVRHPDAYDALPEHTKEYDRVLARFILEREDRLREALRAVIATIDWHNVQAPCPGGLAVLEDDAALSVPSLTTETPE